jgi:hypothetical protein
MPKLRGLRQLWRLRIFGVNDDPVRGAHRCSRNPVLSQGLWLAVRLEARKLVGGQRTNTDAHLG